MDRQTPDQGWQELQSQIEGFFDQVLRVEREKALLGRRENRRTVEQGQSVSPAPDRQSRRDAEEQEPYQPPFSSMEHPCPCMF